MTSLRVLLVQRRSSTPSSYDGTWKRILERLQVQADAQGLITWDVSVDSTVCRAHQHAAGARKKGICSASRPAESTPSRTTTASDAHGAA